MPGRSAGGCANLESSDECAGMTSIDIADPARTTRPGWWFVVLWVAAFVLPIAIQGSIASIWHERGAAPEIGLLEVTVFVLASATGTGLLIRRYVPRPAFWIIGPITSWCALLWIGDDRGWGILSWFTGFLGFPIVLLAFGCVTGVIQSFAFVNADDAWSRHRQARHWIKIALLTSLAMLVAPFVTGNFPTDWSAPFEVSLVAWLVIASAGGVASCAGILWMLRKAPLTVSAGAARSTPRPE
jgi:hypothetical protein